MIDEKQTLCDCPGCVLVRAGAALADAAREGRVEVSKVICGAMCGAVTEDSTVPEVAEAMAATIVAMAMSLTPDDPRVLPTAVSIICARMLERQLTRGANEAVH